MAKAKITITGVLDKKPKVNTDGTIDILIKGSMSAQVPKGLKSLGDSFYLVHIGPKTWKKVSDTLKDDSFLIIQGEPKASKNNKDVPFIEVVCFDISIKADEQKQEAPKDPEKVKPAEVKKPEIQKAAPTPAEVEKVEAPERKEQKDPTPGTAPRRPAAIEWYKPDELTELPLKDIILVDKVHLHTQTLTLHSQINTTLVTGKLPGVIAVRPLEDQPGKYALVMGMKTYVLAKILSFETVPAVIREKEHRELIKELGFDRLENRGNQTI